MANSSHPLVTVLMPVYNGERFVSEAIASILNQTFSDFELLVMNDGSNDGTLDLLRRIADPRLKVVTNDRNIGLIGTLNRGLGISAGTYIARMDADDVSSADRLAQQVRYLEDNPSVHVVGTMAKLIDEDGRQFSVLSDYPTDPDTIHRFLLEECCLIHPTVMYRRDTVMAAGGYADSAKHAEDYDLWLRLSDNYQLANLPDVLVSYRMHRNQVSILNIETQHSVAQECRLAALSRRKALGEDVSGVETIVRPDFLGELTAAECTLGRDLLNWARLYGTMGSRQQAVKLAAKAVARSPLSIEAWQCLLSCSTAAVLPGRLRSAARWYAHRLVSSTKRGRRP